MLVSLYLGIDQFLFFIFSFLLLVIVFLLVFWWIVKVWCCNTLCVFDWWLLLLLLFRRTLYFEVLVLLLGKSWLENVFNVFSFRWLHLLDLFFLVFLERIFLLIIFIWHYLIISHWLSPPGQLTISDLWCSLQFFLLLLIFGFGFSQSFQSVLIRVLRLSSTPVFPFSLLNVSVW